MKKTKKTLSVMKKKETRKNFCVRLLDSEREQIQELADEYCGGCISDWLRVAGLKWKPSKNDLE